MQRTLGFSDVSSVQLGDNSQQDANDDRTDNMLICLEAGLTQQKSKAAGIHHDCVVFVRFQSVV